ncbi:MAG: DsbA family protein, partial [Albimonas sp.]|uniref:DsbA family protein n=1 Tax=Albimonas sp. TaxID=1872425 RepID=UPI0040579B73
GEERYFGFIDLFLTRQSRWARADDIPAELAKMGRQGGLTEEQVNACLADTDAQRALVGMYQEYREDPRFTGTPTLIVGDEKVENPSYENLAAAIEAEM